MINMGMKFRKLLLSAGAGLLTVAMVSVAPAPAFAQNAACKDDSGPSRTLDPSTAKVLLAVYEQMQAEQYNEALAGLNQLISSRGAKMKPFDKATTYELRGSVKASLEDYAGAQRDFKAALDTNALPVARNNQLRYFVAQLSFQVEDYAGAIRGLNEWIRLAQQCGVSVDTNAYYLLAAAYTQVSPPNYRAALGPAEKAVAGATEPRKGYYDLLNLVYSELGDNAKRTPLLEKMVNFWPGNKSYWTQLSGAYSTMGKDRDAFSVLEVAYRAGLLTRESELLTLVQYYSFFENPYRGAVMLNREMDAGTIKRNQKNLVLLSQLWSQAREHKKAIPVLRAAAGQADTGVLYYRLGQVLLADEQYKASARALERALNRGGMKRKDTGDAWLLLGTARFSQAGPEDTAIWSTARKAFVNAQRYEGSRARASSWITYIDAVRSTYDASIRLANQQKLEACQDDIKRMERDQRIRDLQNREATPAELAREQALLDECGPDADKNAAAAPATEEAGLPAADAPVNAGEGEETPDEDGAANEDSDTQN